jgi:hypothetical protein
MPYFGNKLHPTQKPITALMPLIEAFSHSCLSAYYAAARSAATVPNVYAYELYSFPSESPTALRRPRRIESFNIDAYEGEATNAPTGLFREHAQHHDPDWPF